MREEFKGFKIYPFIEKSDLFDEAELCNQEVEDIHATSHGYIYKNRGLWWDKNGAITGMEYIL